MRLEIVGTQQVYQEGFLLLCLYRAEGPQQSSHTSECSPKLMSRALTDSSLWANINWEDSLLPWVRLWTLGVPVMLYGLTGAAQTCQWRLDKVLKHCKVGIDNYVDGCIVLFNSMESHIKDLQRVLSRVPPAGFTLRGSKCFFDRNTIIHLKMQYSEVARKPWEMVIVDILKVPPSSQRNLGYTGLFFKVAIYSGTTRPESQQNCSSVQRWCIL